MSSDASVAAIPFSFPGIENVRCLFSTARAGDMSRSGANDDPPSRRREFMAFAGFSRWAELRQVHGDDIVPARGGADILPGDLREADGQYTAEKGMGLIIKTADCQPLLFCRKDGGAVAALHVGWRGNARDLPGRAVARLCAEFECEPKDLRAVRGPSLGPTASEFVNFDREWPEAFGEWLDRRTMTVNLWALTRRQLERAGMKRDDIFGLDLCTHTMREWFFSHRRKDAGRQIAAIWIAP